jgi:2-oxoisovalerate dehydrogenase E1 component
MPKTQVIHPADLRRAGKLETAEIPLNRYSRSFEDELNVFSPEELKGIYLDMRYIREVETMIYGVRTVKKYNGIEYCYTGPAHLSTGQEAAAVGMAFTLNRDDIIFGSHRSHGEFLARGFRAIRTLSEAELDTIMKTRPDILRVAERNSRSGSIRELAMDFLLYGFICEVFGRANGFNRGHGNSMHVFFPPFGIYPNNAIVGGSAGIAAGAALCKKVNREGGVVVCNFGDGALGRGPVWEAMNFAAMDQYSTLWEDGYRGGLPVIFNCINNCYGMGGQTSGETMAYGCAARVAAGVNPEAMHAERIDGYNPLAVIDAFRRKRALIEANRGPVFLETVTYRYAGHSATDANSYRSQEEIEEWRKADSIIALRQNLEAAGLVRPNEFEAMDAGIVEHITQITRLAADTTISPRPDPVREPDAFRKYNFSNGRTETRPATAGRDVLEPSEENARKRKLAGKTRFYLDDAGNPVSKLKSFTLRDALFEAVLSRAYADDKLIIYGEDNRDWGGAYGVYTGLTEALPYHRLFNAPISEAAIVATAVGCGMCGGHVLIELMYSDFIGCAGDEVFNQLAKWQAMSAGALQMPVVLRVSVGAKYGAQHAQDWTALCTHIPGLKVVYPATPYDAKGMLAEALAGTDPVVFFESQRLYDTPEMFHAGGVPEEDYLIPLGAPDVKRAGNDLTVLTVGPTLYPALQAAERLEMEFHLSTEVIDARSLVPFDFAPVVQSVRKTGRILIVSDACERGSWAQTLAARIARYCFDDLDAPPVAIGAPNEISPCPELERSYYPQPEWILDAVHTLILPLDGYTPGTDFRDEELMRQDRLGI